ncbi:hypothetical protein ACF09H_39205 [Streptomyces sp. NPDC014983]|uniref:hypothetical protein n=1 Tax=Streptomyces sp. NPDC014983 TaxID=3364933 RepID=UPI0036FE0E21
MAFLLCTGVIAAAAGCGSDHAAVPAEFCKVPVSQAALTPLVPQGGSVKQTYTAWDGRPGAVCALGADGHKVLYVATVRWDRAPDPVDWKAVASRFKYAAGRDVSFPGHAVIGSNGAVVQATCASRAGYVSFDVDFSGARVENSPGGYRKLQRFLNDFVPRETKKFDCTH